MRGPNTCFPIAAASKRQGSVSQCTPEAELVAAFYALRMYGVPAVSFWSLIFDREVQVIFHEDNQTMIRIMKTGRNYTMRYLTRTHRLPVAWMHERFKAGDIVLQCEDSDRMAADIYTKAFTDPIKWESACWMINIVDPPTLNACLEFPQGHNNLVIRAGLQKGVTT